MISMPHLITYLRRLGHRSAVLPFQDCHLGAEEGVGTQGPGTTFQRGEPHAVSYSWWAEV